ncbi:B12-binding domain-containing radical SAM protein [Streptomyces sp. CB02959]|uniref:B12-binding domain-containing radical SAM protein n=1 Tax=Streptomyces sp. CB02959 TaxID=2020330 RepID=UPI000C276C8C|nr:B12-binding domain-containing radical SAM protein [Streptomyces sp. CB02959]PJN32320.1 B12-binding domain-containing radical SAM protein [Streptomyces sp. CB02959]
MAFSPHPEPAHDCALPLGAPAPGTDRRMLCVFPRYAPSFGTFHHSFKLVGARAFFPPQGILLIAAFFAARGWTVRIVDENLRALTEADLAWARVVMVSGMHVQRDKILDIASRAHRHRLAVVLGGPSVSAAPNWYPEVDMLHIGELGDATEALGERLEHDLNRPAAQEIYRTKDRTPLEDFPTPAYHLADTGGYLVGTVQSSSGCPFKCEFCDIPELYGRKPRLKTPQQITTELDAMLANGIRDAVYFVDDNFIANPHAAKRLVEHLVTWQQQHRYPVDFTCEATLNITQHPDLLALMRQARFTQLYAGIETPEEDALVAMDKRQNLRSPFLEAIAAINSYGIEVASGVILGLDTDTPDTYDRFCRFIDASHIPFLTINLLQALPHTPLWRRLQAEGRVLATPGPGDSNVRFLLPRETVVNGWRHVIAHAYQPDRMFARYLYQMHNTHPHRLPVPLSSPRYRPTALPRGARIIANVLWHCGIRAPYRTAFWRMATTALLRHRNPEGMLWAAVAGHHLTTFTNEALEDRTEKTFYADTMPDPAPLPPVSND